MKVRPAAESDLDSIRVIASGYGNLASWPQRPDYLDHELASGTLAVSDDGGEITGFGGILERGGVAHLADLFVRPDRLGVGIGKALLAAILPERSERVTFASRDPRAVPLYARFGMSPLAPLLYMEGSATQASSLPAAGSNLVEAEPATVAAHDVEASGRERLQDLEFMKRAGARGFLVLRGTKVAGYGICRLAADQAFIGPAGAASPGEAVATAVSLLRWAAGQAEKVMIPVLGPNPVVPILLEAGFHLEDMDTLMVSREGLFDLHRYFPSMELG